MVGKRNRFSADERGVPRTGRPAHVAAPQASPCPDAQERSLLLLYALSGCLEEEALDFEAHLLGCETCFEDLKTLDRARLLVQEAMAGDPAVLERIRRALGSYRRSLGVAAEPPQRLP